MIFSIDLAKICTLKRFFRPLYNRYTDCDRTADAIVNKNVRII